MKKLALALFLLPLAASAQTIPGYWTCGNPGNVLQRCPCNAQPYTPWTDPITNNVGIYSYDASKRAVPIGCPGGGDFPPPVCLYSCCGGYAHSETWVTLPFLVGGASLTFEVPMQKQPAVDGFYPAPTAEMGLCAQWTGAGNTGPCPISSIDTYRSRIRANPAWTTGYSSRIQPFIGSDPGCTGVQPTATRTPTAGPTPTRTPTQPVPPCATPTPVCPPRTVTP